MDLDDLRGDARNPIVRSQSFEKVEQKFQGAYYGS